MTEDNAIIGASTMWELIERRATASGDHPMLFDAAGRRITFGEFATAVERCAAGLAARGITEGTRVSWQLPTTIEAIIISSALARLGAIHLRFPRRRRSPSVPRLRFAGSITPQDRPPNPRASSTPIRRSSPAVGASPRRSTCLRAT